MSTWQVYVSPGTQSPDSLAAAPAPAEAAPQATRTADTARVPVPPRPAQPADTARAARPAHSAQPLHHLALADSTGIPADSMALACGEPLVTRPASQAHAERPDSLITALLHFQEPDGGAFHDSPYWHPELPARSMGFPCRQIPYRVSADSHAACAVLVCFIMLVYMLIRYGSEMRAQMHDFFLPTRIRQGHHQGLSTAQGLLSMPYVCVMLGMMGSIGVSVMAQDSLALLGSNAARLAVQGFYMAAWLAFLFCKVNSYAFINWIFFNKQARREWHDTLFLILTLEAVLLFPVLLVMVYMSPSTQVFTWSVLSVIALAKVLLLYKATQVFSVKIYGALHLFVYFCTLEVAPLWATLKILAHITDLL